MEIQRSQLLLTKKLDKEIKKMAKAHKVSQSEVVRRLLGQALAMDSQGSQLNQQIGMKYIYELDEFTEYNPRIVGFKELYSVGAPITEVKVLGDETFRYYSKYKKLPKEVEYNLSKAVNTLKDLSETGKLVVRRAYVVPGLENPPGPRFLGLKPSEVVTAITELYRFAIEHEYSTVSGSKICAFFYPFADPKPLTLPIKQGVQLPYGGYAVPSNSESSRVEVLAVWGNNEGVQSFDAIDRYIVNTERMIILEKDIPQKLVMLATTRRDESEKIPVPLDKQFEQVLNDSEILKTARIIKELSGKYGLRRIEYSYNGKDGLEYNESSPYKIHPRSNGNIEMRGIIHTIKSERDVKIISKIRLSEIDNAIIYIDKSIVEKRAYDILNNVASLSHKHTVLYPGLSATAHAMRVLSDFGHTAVTVGNRVFVQGEEVHIKVNEDNIVVIDKLKANDLAKYFVNLYDAKLYGNERVGGKAINLSLLKSKGYNVPHGMVLTTELFDEVLLSQVNKNNYKALFEDKTVNAKLIKELAQKTYKIPDRLWKKILKLSTLKDQQWYAIRSSATVEDQTEHSFAGQFTTHLKVKMPRIKESVEDVIKSTFAPRVAQYFTALGKPWSTKMAVVVQEMPDVAFSGVVFGKDIQTGNEDYIVIDITRGLGEGVVEGTSKTQRIIYSKSRAQIVTKNTGKLKGTLSTIEIDALIEMTLSVERLMGGPQDIEWVIDKNGDIWIVQSRDI